MKYGDIIRNNHAGENNPHRIGVFIKSVKGYIMLSNLNGDVWKTINDKESNFTIIGKAEMRYY